MTPEQFVYWLQGFIEIRETEAVGLTEREWDVIKDHLKEVFEKRTPDRSIVTTTGDEPRWHRQTDFDPGFKFIC